jgi:hypothetical protein
VKIKPGFYWARPRSAPNTEFEPIQVDEDGLTWAIGSDEFVRIDDGIELADEIVPPEHLPAKKQGKLKPAWSTINRVAKGKGLLKGCWLVDPDGEKRATIMDEALARQIAAAMNLTTLEQRIEYAANNAGYRRKQ